MGGEVSVVEAEAGKAERLGGIGEKVAADIHEISGKETRLVVLGHLLRGGSPTSFDRLTALRFGAAAIRGLEEGHAGVMVALDPPHVKYVPIEEAMGQNEDGANGFRYCPDRPGSGNFVWLTPELCKPTRLTH